MPGYIKDRTGIPVSQQKPAKNPFKYKKSLYPFENKPAEYIPKAEVTPQIVKKREIIPIPRHPDDVKKLADDMLAWSELDTSLCIEDFPLSRSYSLKKFFNLSNQHEYFEDALINALNAIGTRRDKHALNREFDGNYVMKTFMLYNTRYKDWEEARMKAIAGTGTTAYTIITPAIPDSPLVPRLEKDTDNA